MEPKFYTIFENDGRGGAYKPLGLVTSIAEIFEILHKKYKTEYWYHDEEPVGEVNFKNYLGNEFVILTAKDGFTTVIIYEFEIS